MKQIFMFRNINGVRVRWLFEVDEQMTIINERPADPQALAQVQSTEPGVRAKNINMAAKVDEMRKANLERHKKELEARGINYIINDKGQIIISNIPEKEKDILRFFNLNGDYEGSDSMQELRARYKAEIEALGGESCPSCQLNTIQRKYREMINSLNK